MDGTYTVGETVREHDKVRNISYFVYSSQSHFTFSHTDHRRESIARICCCALQIFLWKFSLRLEKRLRRTQHISEQNRWPKEEDCGSSARNDYGWWQSMEARLWCHERFPQRRWKSIAISKRRLGRDLLSTSFSSCQFAFSQIKGFTISVKTKVSHKLHAFRKPRCRKTIPSPPSSPQR